MNSYWDLVFSSILLGLLQATTFSPGNPIRIVEIGDSITQGRGDHSGGVEKWEPTFSYRYPLWKMLVDAGVKFECVGSMNGGFESDPNWADYKGHSFARAHEGHWGWKTTDVADKLPGWIQGYTPDIALILLGGNDMSGKTPDERAKNIESVREAMRSIFATLRKRNPKVVILLGQCYPEWEPYPQLRAAMADLAKNEATTPSPVVLVDHSPGWVSDPKKPDTDTVDWMHPNPKGDEKLARNWFKALRPYLVRKEAKQ